ncbi:hypothetical protein ACVB8X_41725 [Streptomyces sp. NRAIS4]
MEHREDLCVQARIISRQAGVAAGIPLAAEIYRPLLLRPSGLTRSVLAGERTVLNFLQRLCGIAVLTSRYVASVRGLPVLILGTRKTVPGLRVAAAGGVTVAVAAVRKGMADEGGRGRWGAIVAAVFRPTG